VTSPRILVVEDDPTIAEAIAARLRSEAFVVEMVADGAEAVRRCRDWRPDLVVLDVMLPSLDGHEVCRRIQAERYVPVVMLTARDTETDLLVGLGVGADDYITKPFSPRELVARIRAVLRRVERTSSSDPKGLRIGDVLLDPAAHAASRAGNPVHLTPTEFALLAHLATTPGQIFTREQLLNVVWDWPGAATTRTVDSHVRSLRSKLGPDCVRTVHGVGYGCGVRL
jgi:DNA-binding response OmpR family regulator